MRNVYKFHHTKAVGQERMEGRLGGWFTFVDSWTEKI